MLPPKWITLYASRHFDSHSGTWDCPKCSSENDQTTDLDMCTGQCIKCKCMVHYRYDAKGYPVYRLVPTKSDIQYMNLMPDKFRGLQIPAAIRNNSEWSLYSEITAI